MTQEAIHLSNNPPLVDPEEIAARHKAAFVAATDVLRSAEDWPAEVNGQEDFDRLSQGVRDVRAAWRTLDNCRDAEKRRFDVAGREVQQLFKPRLTKLDEVKATAEGALTRYNNKLAEQRRVEAAQAAQREREEVRRRTDAAARIAEAGHSDVAQTVLESAVDAERAADKMDRVATGSIADLVRQNSGGGTVTSSSKLIHEIVDQPALRATLGVLADHFGLPEIEKAIRAYIAAEKKAGRAPALAGVRFVVDTKAVVR